MTELKCLALRRLNPYLGVTQVIDSAGGRALSVDGVNWEIQVRAELPAGWGTLNRGRTQIRYYRYAVWSASEDIERLPCPPQCDPQAAAQLAGQLLAAARKAQLPFTLTDTLECWLLENTRRKPLALLSSRAPGNGLPERVDRRWVASPGEGGLCSRSALDSLERWVASRALPGCQWILRAADGGGTLLDIQGHATDERFVVSDFPELLVDFNEFQGAVLEDYLAWCAPRLLMLPLAGETRIRLEKLAARQPIDMARFCRLYPTIVDTDTLNAVRVQARLMSAA